MYGCWKLLFCKGRRIDHDSKMMSASILKRFLLRQLVYLTSALFQKKYQTRQGGSKAEKGEEKTDSGEKSGDGKKGQAVGEITLLEKVCLAHNLTGGQDEGRNAGVGSPGHAASVLDGTKDGHGKMLDRGA